MIVSEKKKNNNIYKYEEIPSNRFHYILFEKKWIWKSGNLKMKLLKFKRLGRNLFANLTLN